MLEHLRIPFDKAVVYCRVSKKSQDIELQEGVCLSFAKDRQLEVIDVFKEKVSGTFTDKNHRPELYKALDCCAKNNAILIAKDASRIFRNIDGLPMLQSLGVVFVLEEEIKLPFFIGYISEIIRKGEHESLCVLAEYIMEIYKQNQIESVWSNGYFQKIKTKDNYNIIISQIGVEFGNDERIYGKP